MINFVYSETFNGKGSNSEEFAFVLNDTITKTIPPTSDIDPKLIALGKDTSGNDFYWRIIRTNEDGGVSLIFNRTSKGITPYNKRNGILK